MKLGNAVKYRYKKLFKAAAVYFVLLCTVILAGLIASFISKTDRSINLIYVSENARPLRNGGLSDIAPTMLKILGLPKPDDMTGTPLF